MKKLLAALLMLSLVAANALAYTASEKQKIAFKKQDRVNQALTLGYDWTDWFFVNSAVVADTVTTVKNPAGHAVCFFQFTTYANVDSLWPMKVTLYRGDSTSTLWVPFGPDSLFIKDAEIDSTLHPFIDYQSWQFPIEVRVLCDSLIMHAKKVSAKPVKWACQAFGYE